MRPKALLLILAAIILVLPATGIVNAEEAAATTEQLACVAQTPADGAEETSIQTEAYTNTCGSCSVSQCRGVTRGTPCGFGVWCIPTNTLFCPGTSDWDCQCAKNYN